MSAFFSCKNGQNVTWSSVCDGLNQCKDGSDELNCYCRGDIYACLQGNNVSCRFACAMYGHVTCLTYHNTRACKQYMQEQKSSESTSHLDLISAGGDSSTSTGNFDALRYSAILAAGILLCVSIISIIIYLIRKYPSNILFSCANKSFGANSGRKSTRSPSSESAILPASILLQQQQQQQTSLPRFSSRYTSPPNTNDLPPSYYSDQNPMSAISDCYEPPPYPGPPLLSSIQRSDSIYYETIKTPSTSNSMSMLHPMPLPEPRAFASARMHCV